MTVPTLTTLADVVTSLKTPEVVVLERSGGVTINSEGVAVPGTTTSTILGDTVVHPISGTDRSLLPEGYRTRETIVTYSVEPLRTVLEYGNSADRLVRTPFGEPESRYIVVTVENWAYASGHWRVFATREPPDDA